MVRFSPLALSLFLFSSSTTTVLGAKPCYPLGGAATCYDPTASLASGCKVDKTEKSVKMCCPAGVNKGYYKGDKVTCKGKSSSTKAVDEDGNEIVDAPIDPAFIGMKPCYPKGGAEECFDLFADLVPDCTIDSTGTLIDMCCPADVFTGYKDGDTVTCSDGSDMVATMPADPSEDMPDAAAIADAVADGVIGVIDSLYGTPPPTPAPTEEEDNKIDDLVNEITDTAMDILESISP